MPKHHEAPMGHCMGCVPVRLGVLLLSCYLLFSSICAVAGIVTEDTRVLVGGYTLWSNMAVTIMGVIGLVLSLMSITGVSDNHQRWVYWFACFVAVRVVVRALVFWADWNMLENCDKFGLSSLTSSYNAAMEMVKLQGHCGTITFYHGFVSILDIVLTAYGAWNAFYWVSVLENGPMYHIALDDSKPVRVYTGYSTVGHPDAPPIKAAANLYQEAPSQPFPGNNYGTNNTPFGPTMAYSPENQPPTQGFNNQPTYGFA